MAHTSGARCDAWADPEGGGAGGPDPMDNYKNIGDLSNTGQIPLKSQSYQFSIQFWAIIGPPAKTPFEWRFAGGSMMARL